MKKEPVYQSLRVPADVVTSFGPALRKADLTISRCRELVLGGKRPGRSREERKMVCDREYFA